MKILLSLLLVISLNVFGQTEKVDSVALKYYEEKEANTSIKEFRIWIYENNVGTKDFEAFMKLRNYFLKQKYLESKAKK